jgi:hypothetical protein
MQRSKVGEIQRGKSVLGDWATPRRWLAAGTHQPQLRSCGASNPHIDFAAECPEINIVNNRQELNPRERNFESK